MDGTVSGRPPVIAGSPEVLTVDAGEFREPTFRVFIRNGANQLVDELTDWTALELLLRFNGVGTWTLEMSADSPTAALIARNGGIVVTREVAGSVETIFSGFVSTELTWTATTFRAAGRSDDALLEEAICRPNPEQPFGPFPNEYYVFEGAPGTTMATLVAVNIGHLAPAFWRRDIVLGPYPTTGAPVIARGRFQPLSTILAELAGTEQAGGLGFKLLQSDTSTSDLEFEIYAPVDRSADVKFAVELDTARDYEDTWTAPDGNYFYVLLGDGLGGNRSVLENGDVPSIQETGRIIARVIDRRGVTDTSEGQQALAEALAGAISSQRAAIVTQDIPSIQYGVDWDLGDLVTVTTRSGTRVDVIREITISLDPEHGITITPVVGQGPGTDDERIVNHITAVQGRLSNLERNFNVPPDSVARSMLVPVLKPPIGQVAWLATATVPVGWLWANGQAVSRTTYAQLFGAIGTTWGMGDGVNTFNVPNLTNRSPIGSGGTYGLGQLVGNSTANLAHSHTGAPHTHATPLGHSHGLSNHTHVSQPHTHAGSGHSHTLAAHRHQMGHDHDIDIGPFNSGYTDVDPVAVGHGSLGSGAFDHKHNVDIANSTTTNANNTVTGSGELTSSGANFSTTGTDTTAPPATYTGLPGAPFPNSTEADLSAPAATYTAETGGAGAAALSLVHPSAGLLPVIYAG
jgi:microcystin-dependent protein